MQKALTWEGRGLAAAARAGCVGAFLAGDVLSKATIGMTQGVLRGGNKDLEKHCLKSASHDAVVVSMS